GGWGGSGGEWWREGGAGRAGVDIRMPASTVNDLFIKETEAPARALGVQLIPVVIRGSDDLDRAFRAMTKERGNGLLSRLGPSFNPAQHKRLAEFAVKNRLPAISSDRDWGDSGGLIFYGRSEYEGAHRVATYVDKILKGAKPSDLPVEGPMKFEFIINLKTANQIGVNIPQSMLFRADRVIK